MAFDLSSTYPSPLTTSSGPGGRYCCWGYCAGTARTRTGCERRGTSSPASGRTRTRRERRRSRAESARSRASHGRDRCEGVPWRGVGVGVGVVAAAAAAAGVGGAGGVPDVRGRILERPILRDRRHSGCQA